MLEVSSRTYIDTRTGLMMFQMNMSKDGTASSTTTSYQNLVDKKTAESEMCRMITDLCNNVYNVSEIKG